MENKLFGEILGFIALGAPLIALTGEKEADLFLMKEGQESAKYRSQ